MASLSKTTQTVGWTLISLVLIGLFEGAGYIYLTHLRDGYPRLFHFDLKEFVDGLPQAKLEQYAKHKTEKLIYEPHPTLGWIRNANTQMVFPRGFTITTDSIGSRVIDGETKQALISTYGDSFTEGLEVNDDETWQTFTSQLLGKEVTNFGVSAYGPDQALLYIEHNAEKGLVTPVVILAMIQENMNRIMNTFRMFYTYPTTDIFLGFKPMFLGKEGEKDYQVINFLTNDFLDRKNILHSIQLASEEDAFYALRQECVCLPFGINAVQALLKNGVKPNYRWPGLTEAAKDKLSYILRRFVAVSKKYNFKPVFVLLPQDVHQLKTRDGQFDFIHDLVKASSLTDLLFIDVVRELSGENHKNYLDNFDNSRFIKWTHPSAYGNKAIAKVLSKKLAVTLPEQTP